MSEAMNQGSAGECDRQITQQSYWEECKDDFEGSRNQMRMIYTGAKGLYANLPYHNFDHAKEVTWEALRLARICNQNAVPVNTKVLFAAALYHDAGYHVHTVDSGYESKEAYSAAVFEGHARNFGFNEEEIELGTGFIMVTKLGTKPESVEEKIMIRSDIDNVGGNYFSSFRARSALLLDEEQLLAKMHGRSFNRLHLEINSLRVLATYLNTDLSLGEFDQGEWSSNAIVNIRRLAIELAREQNTMLTKFVQGLGSAALSKLLLARNPEKNT